MDDPLLQTTAFRADDDAIQRGVPPHGQACMAGAAGAREATLAGRPSMLLPKPAYLANWSGKGPGVPAQGEDD